MTVEILPLESPEASSTTSRQAAWIAQLDQLSRARTLTLNRRPKSKIAATERTRAVAEPVVATIPLVPRSLAHLPAKRWSWAARRRLAQDHPFGRIAQIEASLEQLVGELEAEVDRLVARTGELVSERND